MTNLPPDPAVEVQYIAHPWTTFRLGRRGGQPVVIDGLGVGWTEPDLSALLADEAAQVQDGLAEAWQTHPLRVKVEFQATWLDDKAGLAPVTRLLDATFVAEAEWLLGQLRTARACLHQAGVPRSRVPHFVTVQSSELPPPHPRPAGHPDGGVLLRWAVCRCWTCGEVLARPDVVPDGRTWAASVVAFTSRHPVFDEEGYEDLPCFVR